MSPFAANQAVVRQVAALSGSPLFAPALEMLIETNMVIARQRRLQQRLVGFGGRGKANRRVEREQLARVALDPAKASGHPKVWWHEGGSGPPLVLLNGWTASGLMWPAAFVAELEASHRVIRIDNRGTGYSRTAPAPYLIRTLADDAAQVLRATTPGAAIVVGLSMGGMIAQELTIRNPALVRRLVLVGTRPPAPAHIDAAPDVLSRATATARAGESIENFIADMWSCFCAPGFDRVEHRASLDDLIEQVLRRVTPRSAVNHQMQAIAAWHGPGRLGQVRCPTTVVHGDADRLMPVGNGTRLAQLIPDARYVELANVGHIVPMEAGPDLVSIIDRGG